MQLFERLYIGQYHHERENRRRTIVRVVCIVVAVAMLGSLIVPAIYAGL